LSTNVVENSAVDPIQLPKSQIGFLITRFNRTVFPDFVGPDSERIS
jgi:hypothetical protein